MINQGDQTTHELPGVNASPKYILLVSGLNIGGAATAPQVAKLLVG